MPIAYITIPLVNSSDVLGPLAFYLKARSGGKADVYLEIKELRLSTWWNWDHFNQPKY